MDTGMQSELGQFLWVRHAYDGQDRPARQLSYPFSIPLDIPELPRANKIRSSAPVCNRNISWIPSIFTFGSNCTHATVNGFLR
jgi:hypothetical protein